MAGRGGSWQLVEGSEDFLKLATELREADRKLANRVRRSLREVAKPLGEDARDSLASDMPRGGGLSDIVTAAKVAVSTLGGKGARVEVRVRAPGIDLEAMNRGALRHPVFGRNAWVSQSVPAGGATRALDDGLEPMREAVHREVEKLLREIS